MTFDIMTLNMTTKTTSSMTRRLARAVLLAGLALPATALLAAGTPLAISKAQAATTQAAMPVAPSTAGKAETLAEFRAVLANYGTFGTHEKYGEIWVPTVTPQGWHPYPPCQWVYTKDGWYFDDQTPWGAIVHHYGRWSHDEKIGWFWVPDEAWSPGWVVWRKSDKWIGWAPMPPEQDAQLVSSPEFNNDKLWIFMAAEKFLNGSCGDAVTTVQAPQVFYETNYVTLFDLPPGLLVDIVFVTKWKTETIYKLIKIPVLYCPPNYNPPNNNPPNGNPPGKLIPMLHKTDLTPPARSEDPKPNRPRIDIDLKPRGEPSGRPGISINVGKPDTSIKGGGTNGHGGSEGSSSRGSGGATPVKPIIGLVHPSGQKPTILNRFRANVATGGQQGRHSFR